MLQLQACWDYKMQVIICQGFDFDNTARVLVRFLNVMYLQNLFLKIFSYFHKVDGQSIRQEFKHAFSIGAVPENNPLNEKEVALIVKLATMVQRRRLSVPATMFLECMQPLNYLGSQLMVFFRPFLTFFFTPEEYDAFQGILEKREGVKRVIEELEKRIIR